MTLHTRIAVLGDGVTAADAMSRMAALIDAPDGYRWASKDDTADAAPDQGARAWLWVTGAASAEEHDAGFCDEDCTGAYHDPAHVLMLNLDTAYSYQEPNGASCGDLHAWVVSEIGAWLDGLGIAWRWFDESGAGWNTTNDDLSGLGSPEVGKPASKVRKADRDARRDFLMSVLPAILADGVA